MTATTNTSVDVGDGWVALSTDPDAISITPTHAGAGTWHLAIAAGVPAADFLGEVYHTPLAWNGSGIIGTIYVRVETPMIFAVTE